MAGVSKSFTFVLRASDSICHSFSFVSDQSWPVPMTIPRSCLPILVFLHSPALLSRAVLLTAYLAAKVRAA
jgi:hypothetical protein